MSEKSFIKFQIRYLKSFLKHTAFVARENKTVRNIQARLSTEWWAVMRNMQACRGDRDVASRKLNQIEAEMKALYKPFDIDSRFEWKGSHYEKFPHYVRYEKDGKPRVHHFNRKEMVTAAHILYNKLRHKKTHLKDGDKEHEYTHTLTYWTERLAFVHQEECARCLRPRDFISPRDGVGECGVGIVGTDTHSEGAGSHE